MAAPRPPAAQTATTGPAPVARREPLRGLTVLYDPHCRVCAFVGGWLAGQRKLIPLRLVPVGSEQARRLFPALDHEGATRREITAVGDAGQVYVGDSAWVVCLWALADHRALAHAMSTPSGRRLARAAMLGVAKYRNAQGTPPGCRPARPSGARRTAAPRPRGLAARRAGAYALGLQRGRRLDRAPSRAPRALRGRVCAAGSGQPLGSP
ncbi:DCC1-like thiol-disulfide oxidoreductase family protein [Actinacidiphila bryophytorum]|uniref:DCC1-like thiol-disulfide oxidoreductase family protein n=1 Tax=Actinacidiphila bryophytorum TaxID=1436133 RepID=UPI002176A3B7|nr:DCC1-like thiol-disulfide oxidoreductase family protein [Actinacidiphila bryophytorum]UWE12637.1 DCC1-like thiol-disulfide oxidoreductase family protein [Actinacidiphila bryophytorum]